MYLRQLQLMRLYARRGAALCQQGHYKIALDDLKSALQFDASSESLAADIGTDTDANAYCVVSQRATS